MTTTLGNKVLLDTDGIIGFVRVKDLSHFQAQMLMEKLVQSQGQFLVAATTVTEAVTTLRRKFSEPKLALGVLESAIKNWEIISIDTLLISEAQKYYLSSHSKKNTLFDAINIAVVKKYKLDAIFSFDSWYKKHGVKLAGDLV